MKYLAIASLLLICGFATADMNPQVTQTVPVHSYVPARELSPSETQFLATVPVGGRLREAVRQMLQAGVCHVPVGGRYRPGDSERYWSMYQVWTAPYRAEMPVRTVERVVERPVVKTQVITVPQPIIVPQPVMIPARQFIQPAGVSAVWTPATPVPAGSITVGPWQDRVWLSLFQRPSQQVCPTKSPGQTCDPGGGPSQPPSTGEAGSGIDPGSGSQGPGHGSPGGYGSGGATLPAPPPGYGSTTPPTAGPLPPAPPGKGGGSPGGSNLVHLKK